MQASGQGVQAECEAVENEVHRLCRCNHSHPWVLVPHAAVIRENPRKAQGLVVQNAIQSTYGTHHYAVLGYHTVVLVSFLLSRRDRGEGVPFGCVQAEGQLGLCDGLGVGGPLGGALELQPNTANRVHQQHQSTEYSRVQYNTAQYIKYSTYTALHTVQYMQYSTYGTLTLLYSRVGSG